MRYLVQPIYRIFVKRFTFLFFAKTTGKNIGSVLMSSAPNYSDAYILLNGTVTIPNTGTVANPNNRRNMIIKNCTPFTDCMSEKNNTKIDNAKYIDIVISVYNLIEYSDNYPRTYGRFWQCYRDETFLDDNGAIACFPADDNNSASFKFKTKIAGRTGNDG